MYIPWITQQLRALRDIIRSADHKMLDRLARSPGQLGLSIVKGVSGSLFIRLTQAALGFVISIILARLLGPEGIGNYAATLALITLLSIPSQVGFSQVVLRFTALYETRSDLSSMRSLWIWGSGGIGIYIALVSLVHFAIAYTFDSIITPFGAVLYTALFSAICINGFLVSVLKGLRAVLRGQAFDPIRNIVFLGMLAVTIASGKNVSYVDVLTMFTISVCVGMFVSGVLLKLKLVSFPKTTSLTKSDVKWMKSLVPFIIVGGLMTLYVQLDILMVKKLSTAEEAGYFQVAYQFSSLTLFGLTAIILGTGPYFVKFHEEGDKRRLQSLVRRSSQASLSFAGISAAAVSIFSTWIVSNLYGVDFEESSLVLVVMSAAYLIQASTGASATLLTMTGNEAEALKAACYGLLGKLSFGLLLIPPYGALGAAFSMMFAFFVLNLFYYRAAKRCLDVNILPA